MEREKDLELKVIETDAVENKNDDVIFEEVEAFDIALCQACGDICLF